MTTLNQIGAISYNHQSGKKYTISVDVTVELGAYQQSKYVDARVLRAQKYFKRQADRH